MKRILLCTFMLCCCISSLFADIWTDENGVEWYFSVNGNEATITSAYNLGTEVIVPEKVFNTYQPAEGDAVTEEYIVTGFGYDSRYDFRSVFEEGKANISKVTLPSTIKTINTYAFYGCSSLKSVDGLSSCSSIGSSAFYNCISLESVGDLSACTSIGNQAFYYCSSLPSVDLPACTSIGNSAFSSCSSLQSVGDLSACTSIGSSAFYNCISLESVGDLSACTSIGSSAFNSCYALESIVDLPECVAINERAFYNCSSLKSIGNLPKCEVIGDEAFLCEDYYESIDGIGQWIEVSSSLASIGNLPVCKTIGAKAFFDCGELTTIGDLLACESIKSQAFFYCDKLTSINLQACTTIGIEAFYCCSALTSVGDLSACTTIGNDAFRGCFALTSVGDLSACTTIGNNAFFYCRSLQSVGDLPVCISIGSDAFNSCYALESIGDLPECVEISNRVFYNCSSLKSIGNLPKCEAIGDEAFLCDYYIEDQHQIFVASSLASIGNLPACKTIGEKAFYDCNELTTIGDLPACESIKSEAFRYCDKLTSINLQACTSIGNGAFSSCSSLESVGDLSACTTIGNNAFFYCRSLQLVGDLSNCASIGNYAFYGCNSIKTITFSDKPATLEGIRSLGDFAMLRIPSTALAAYQNAPIWSEPELKNRLITIDDVIDYDVETSAQSAEPGLGRKIDKDDMRKVVTLKVSGTINSYDIIAMNNKMINLRWLDLSDATIVGCDHEYYTGYTTSDNIVGNRMFYDHDKYISIKLPKNAERIDAEAFAECNNLKEVELYEGIKSIGSSAFYRCNSIKQMDIPSGCEDIAGRAFYECSDLQEVLIGEGCKGIGYGAFKYCTNLHTIKIGEGCETISSDAFSSCSDLKVLALPTTLKQIDDYAFRGCSSLEIVSLPTHLNSIGAYAFQNCDNMVELKIPSSVMYFGNYAFSGCDKLKKVYTYTLEPTTIIEETFAKSIYSTATLYVPKTSYNNYEYNTEWSQFVNHEDFDEPYEYFYINKDYVLDDQTGVVGGKPDGDLNPGSGFIQEGTEDQEMGDIHIKDDGNTSGSIIGDGNIDAENLFFDMTIEGGRWYFFCFPFKVYLSDITCPGQHVWRKYDGKKRADKGEGGWVDLDADEDHLKKGYGYIFQASQSGTLTLKVTKAQFGKFENADHHHAVEKHPAQDENNASWNFMGNPHTSYYGIGEMGYDAPITIWTGTTYEALRPGDDDYYLKPFQAFFVQKTEGTDEIAFEGDSRMTYLQSEQAQKEAKARRMARGINPDRLLVNLTLTDGTHTDKTRVVFNDKQSIGYEMACDAAKFMSTEGTPQLYTLDNKHIRYAINERPNGDVTMGYSVSKEGTYTISVARMDKPMVLRDLEMGITFDLSNGDYTFTSKAGTNEKRFVLSANQSETGIADIMKETGVNIMAVEGGIHISGLNGQTVYIYDLSGAAIATQATDGTAAVKAGTYVIKVDNLSTKLLVK